MRRSAVAGCNGSCARARMRARSRRRCAHGPRARAPASAPAPQSGAQFAAQREASAGAHRRPTRARTCAAVTCASCAGVQSRVAPSPPAALPRSELGPRADRRAPTLTSSTTTTMTTRRPRWPQTTSLSSAVKSCAPSPGATHRRAASAARDVRSARRRCRRPGAPHRQTDSERRRNKTHKRRESNLLERSSRRRLGRRQPAAQAAEPTETRLGLGRLERRRRLRRLFVHGAVQIAERQTSDVVELTARAARKSHRYSAS